MPAHTFQYVDILPPLSFKGNCMLMLRMCQSLSEMDTSRGLKKGLHEMSHSNTEYKRQRYNFIDPQEFIYNDIKHKIK